jgi:DNA-binding transcriptional LysR family regulator
MSDADLNLLVTLDVLLTEGSVAGAARRLRLSPSAMSRALARLRETTGDPLLVRAGRGLVPTPRAMALREHVSQLVQDAKAVLRPTVALDLSGLTRTFTIQTGDGFVENFGALLIEHVEKQAPGVRLFFVQKSSRDSTPLRDSLVDIETGVIGAGLGPEIKTQALFRDRFIGVVRAGHRLSKGKVTVSRYSAERHVALARNGQLFGPVDTALETAGARRNVITSATGFAAALAIARNSDVVATVPEKHTETLRADLYSFALPVAVPDFTVSMLWHPRQDADPAHRWLRGCLQEICSGRQNRR